jgi:type IV pilus assembly protein PilM
MSSEGRNLVGVDIGSSSIKVCEIKEGRGGDRTITRFGYHPLPPETIVDGHVINSGAVVEGLEKLFSKSKRRNIALRASGHSVIIKKITMPLMTPAELKEQISWEAEQHIPFDLDEVHIDYEILHERGDHGQMEVLLVAAKKEEITDLTNLAMEARLKPMVVDLDAFTVQNVYEQAYSAPSKDESIVLAHVGAATTTVNILADSTTAFTRDIANGGNLITEEIQRQLNIGRDEAESYKCGGQGLGIVPREVPEIVDMAVDQLAGEIQRSLDFYLATSGDRDLNKLYLSGGTAHIQALQDAIESRARVSVELLNPIKLASVEPEAAVGLEGRGPEATVSIGLALRKERERN